MGGFRGFQTLNYIADLINTLYGIHYRLFFLSAKRKDLLKLF